MKRTLIEGKKTLIEGKKTLIEQAESRGPGLVYCGVDEHGDAHYFSDTYFPHLWSEHMKRRALEYERDILQPSKIEKSFYPNGLFR